MLDLWVANGTNPALRIPSLSEMFAVDVDI